MSYGRSCIGGVHVFRMAYLTICYVLLKDMSYWRSCLLDGRYYRGHVLLLEMSYWGVIMSFMRICVMGGHV